MSVSMFEPWFNVFSIFKIYDTGVVHMCVCLQVPQILSVNFFL